MSAEESQSNESSYAETVIGPNIDYSKEQQDIALAAVILRTGLLTERELSKAFSNWTIYGSVPLSMHLHSMQLLDETQLQNVSSQAMEQLEACTGLAFEKNSSGSKSVLLSTLDRIDPSGTIARLMGIRAVVGTGANDRTGGRQAVVRYQFVRKLGQGGLGRVWLAFDHHLKRHVAVKEITVRNNPSALERFQREAEITGQLEHPGIVPIYQLGEDSETGEVFYAMRFLGKRTFHDAILEYHERRNEGDDDPMLIRQLLTDFVNICQAIGHAHSRKVIHRDLKPENVAIDSFGQVIVIDWGIAKVLDEIHLADRLATQETIAGSHNSTMEGQVLGTPLYMAPEQAGGRIDEMDERTDIYGLGGILFAILSGYAPHEKTRELANTTGGRDLLSAIAARPTPDVCELNPDVDEALAAICAKAMARKQYARYQTATQLAEDVQRWMAGEPVTAHREKSIQRLTRWIRHHQVLSQLLAATFTIGIVALATWGIAAQQNHAAEKRILFDEMQGFEREIHLQVESTRDELAKDSRFMSTLPPIQGIIDARNGVMDNEGEEVWIARLQTIYEGLLRANPEYLAISYATVSNEGEPGQNLVRVERHSSDMGFIQALPASRLGEFGDQELLRETASRSPGDILLVIRPQHASQSGKLLNVRLLACAPVFDKMTGDLFGLVTIETNLLSRIVDFLERLEQRTDGHHSDYGREGRHLGERRPGDRSQLSNTHDQRSRTISRDGKFLYDRWPAATARSRKRMDCQSCLPGFLQLGDEHLCGSAIGRAQLGGKPKKSLGDQPCCQKTT